MKALSEAVTAKVDSMIADGTIEDIIDAKVEQTVKESIESAFKSYGEFGKAITAKVEEAIQCSHREIELPTYNQFIKNVVVEKFTALLEERSVKHLAELVEAAIPPVTKQAKFSDILNKITELWTDLARENSKDCIRISADMNNTGTALYVSITAPDYKDVTRVTFYKFEGDTWHIGYINEGRITLTGRHVNVARTYTNAVTNMFFQYYAMHTEFTSDVEFEDISTDY